MWVKVKLSNVGEESKYLREVESDKGSRRRGSGAGTLSR
jgi:hypothetical protein